MRKIYKIIGGMLAAGVLVAGIGSGVAFAEYSSFEYGGEAMLEGSERFTKTVQYKVSEKTDILNVMTDVHNNYYDCYTVVEDDVVPKDKIQVIVSYLSDDKDIIPKVDEVQIQASENMDEFADAEMDMENMDESINMEPDTAEETTESTVTESKTKDKSLDKVYEYIVIYDDYEYNDFRDIMRAKGRILSDLKNHKLSDYQLDKVEKIEIHVNPKADFTIQIGEDNAY